MVPPAAADPSPLVAAAAAATEVGAAACAAKAPKAAPVKVVWVMVDGLGDVDVRAVDALAGASPRRGEEYDSGGCRRAATPLALARTPALDALACAGLNGLVDPVEPGLACGSDTAHLSMLSYAPSTYYVGRGAFESLGAGLDMAPGEIAFKCNFATLETGASVEDECPVVVRRRADRNFEALGPTLCAALDGTPLPGWPEHSVSVRYATEHRCGVVVHGPGLSGNVSGTDPLKDGRRLMRCEPTDDTTEACTSAKVVQVVSDAFRRVLSSHPINAERRALGMTTADVVLLRGCGVRLDTEPFPERHGLRAAMVAPTKVIAGMGIQLGFDILSADGATGDYHTDLGAKAARVASALRGSDPETTRTYDMCFAHVKAIDDAGHDGNAPLKVNAIEAVDAMLARLMGLLWREERGVDGAGAPLQARGTRPKHIICVTADHSTPVAFGDHSLEPVPFAVARLVDAVEALGEQACLEASTDPSPIRICDPSNGLNCGTGDGCTCGDNECHNKLTCKRRFLLSGALMDADTNGAPGPDFKGGAGGRPQRRRQAMPSGESIDASPEAVPPLSKSNAARTPLGAAKRSTLAGTALGFTDGVAAFSEIEAVHGVLGRFPGSEIMPLLKRFAAATADAAHLR